MRCRAALLPVAEMLLPGRAGSAACERGQGSPRSRRERGRAHLIARLDRAPEMSPGFGTVTKGSREPPEMMGDGAPVRAAAAEAIEDHVPVGVRLEQVLQDKPTVAIA